jgi:hypothetical protein
MFSLISLPVLSQQMTRFRMAGLRCYRSEYSGILGIWALELRGIGGIGGLGNGNGCRDRTGRLYWIAKVRFCLE